MSSITKTQLPWPELPVEAPGSGSPVFRGLRVVELASIVAAPSICRVLSDLGAEVVKVEGPGGPGKGGDPTRSGTLAYETSYRKARGVSFNFEFLHLGKRSLCLDLRKQREEFMELLRGADVFVTNVLPHQLHALRLDYDDIKGELPHLIFAQFSAWGRTGPDRLLPGYDIGAFWAATGMAHEAQEPWMYDCYPSAFGDVTTGMSLFGGICLALGQRLRSGRGQLVTSSLYGAGMFCMAPSILAAEQSKEEGCQIQHHAVPDYSNGSASQRPLAQAYTSGDGVYFAIGAVASNRTAETTLAEALHVDSTATAFQKAFSAMSFSAIEELAASCKLPLVRGTDYDTDPNREERLKPCYEPLHGVADLATVAKVPFDFSCTQRHKSGFQAVALGAHNQAWRQHGWPARHPASFATSSDAPFTVVELSEPGTSVVSAATLQLVDALPDCEFVLLKLDDEADWSRSHPRYASHLARGKRVVPVQTGLEARKHLLDIAAGGHVVFVTNWRESLLRESGLDYEHLKADIPKLIMGLVTPLGMGHREEVRGEVASWYMSSSMPHLVSGVRGPRAKTMPAQLGELCTSFCVAGGLGAAMFHFRRTGEGQQVHVSLQRASTWSSGFAMSTFMCNWETQKHGSNGFEGSLVGKEWWERQPPLMSSFVTKDGAWICYTPVAKAIEAAGKFGFPVSGMATLAGTVVWSKLSLSGEPTFQAAYRGLAKWRSGIQAKISTLTLREFQKFALQQGLHWAPVLTIKEVLKSQQAFAGGALSWTPQGLMLTAPNKFGLTEEQVQGHVQRDSAPPINTPEESHLPRASVASPLVAKL